MWGPYIFGSVPIYHVFVVTGVLVGIAVAVLSAREIGQSAWRVVLFEISVSVIALLGAKLYGAIEEGSLATFQWRSAFGGLRYPGGIIALMFSLPVLTRVILPGVSLAALADLISPSIGFAMAAVRIGCLLHGCCFGIVSHLPWAVRFPLTSPAGQFHDAQLLLTPESLQSLPVHPLQIYFGLWSAGVATFLLWFRRRKAYDGQVFLVFLALHEWGKFSLEFLRAPVAPEAGFYLKLMSLALAILACGMLAARQGFAGREAASAH